MTPKTACFFVVLALCVGCAETRPDATWDEQAKTRAAETSITLWDYFLKQHLKEGDDLQKVRDLMQSRSVDWGRAPLGGGGAYYLCFKLDDFIQARFLFSGSDKLISFHAI